MGVWEVLSAARERASEGDVSESEVSVSLGEVMGRMGGHIGGGIGGGWEVGVTLTEKLGGAEEVSEVSGESGDWLGR